MIDLYNDDCLNILETLPQDSIDLIFTSPPYADRRKDTYGGCNESDYVQWFSGIAEEMKRILKPSGSLFINIKPHSKDGQRSLYVFDLVLHLCRALGYKLVDELCWTKNAYPGAFQGRFKNGFEPIYHFITGDISNITFNPYECGTPIKRLSRKRAKGKQCGTPENGSKMGAISCCNILKAEIARPSNVLHIHNVVNQFTDKQKHPATFPLDLPEFFIKSFSNESDVVLDPFMGSGTTGIVAKQLNRKFIGIELQEEYFELSKNLIKNTKSINYIEDW